MPVELVVALEVGILLHQQVGGLVGVLLRVLVALRQPLQESGEHRGLLLDRVPGGVERQRIELHAGVPQAQGDRRLAQPLDRRRRGQPAGHRVGLAGQQRREVRADDHDLDVLLRNIVLLQQRCEQDLAGRLDADLLADHVLRLADRLLLEREEGVGVLLQHRGEALHRDLLGRRQHQGRARRDLADLVPAGGHDRHAVDAGSARLDHDVELLLLEVAHVLGDDLADVVVAGEPAELEVDRLRLGLGESARWQEICSGSRGGGSPGEQCAAAHYRVLPQLCGPRRPR